MNIYKKLKEEIILNELQDSLIPKLHNIQSLIEEYYYITNDEDKNINLSQISKELNNVISIFDNISYNYIPENVPDEDEDVFINILLKYKDDISNFISNFREEYFESFSTQSRYILNLIDVHRTSLIDEGEEILTESTETKDIDECENNYYNYVNTHIENVQKAWNEEVSTIDDNFIQKHIDELTEQIKHHDESKWSEDEFDAYRANYNPINDQEKIDNEANFQAAWYHHFQNNPHHWQHWIDENGELKPLENKDIVKMNYVEMICDWQAMGYVFGDTAYQYYEQNKDTIKIYPELKSWFKSILNKLEKV